MSYFKDTYLNNIRPMLADYVTDTQIGQNTPDVYLSLANRAQQNLWAKKPWTDLATDVIVSLVNGSYTFPVDYGRIISIYASLSGNGTADYWYYEGDNEANGYKMRDAFTKALGHAWTITFNYAQANNPLMIYQRILDDFTGVGDEITFFPSNLLLLECQKIALREKGDLKELQAAELAFAEVFKDYCNCHQWINFDTSAVLRDRNQNRMFIEQYSLEGSNIGEHTTSPYPNSKLSA